MVDDPTVLAQVETLLRERSTQAVAAELLESFAVVSRDEAGCVQREPGDLGTERCVDGRVIETEELESELGERRLDCDRERFTQRRRKMPRTISR